MALAGFRMAPVVALWMRGAGGGMRVRRRRRAPPPWLVQYLAGAGRQDLGLLMHEGDFTPNGMLPR